MKLQGGKLKVERPPTNQSTSDIRPYSSVVSVKTMNMARIVENANLSYLSKQTWNVSLCSSYSHLHLPWVIYFVMNMPALTIQHNLV